MVALDEVIAWHMRRITRCVSGLCKVGTTAAGLLNAAKAAALKAEEAMVKPHPFYTIHVYFDGLVFVCAGLATPGNLSVVAEAPGGKAESWICKEAAA